MICLKEHERLLTAVSLISATDHCKNLRGLLREAKYQVDFYSHPNRCKDELARRQETYDAIARQLDHCLKK